jgi:peptidoglycan/xylan/chitin deacetylase (PgdA/CDA1 family)
MKYEVLKAFLQARQQSHLRMSFDEVAKAAGTKLPASAYRYPAWWANDPSGAHVQARAWLDAGFRAEQVDLEAKRVVFVRVKSNTQGVRGVHESEFQPQSGTPAKKHPMIGAMKGTFTIAPGWDLTRPALDPEELAEWEASLDRKADRYLKGPRG